MKAQELGRTGEKLAQKYLRSHGYQVLETNARTRFGEIDLVCRKGNTIVFVEVKARSSHRFGTPLDAVGVQKQQRLRRLAEAYLVAHGWESAEVRFDVLSIMMSGPQPLFEHLPGAF